MVAKEFSVFQMIIGLDANDVILQKSSVSVGSGSYPLDNGSIRCSPMIPDSIQTTIFDGSEESHKLDPMFTILLKGSTRVFLMS
ncbi:hypothetical protein TNCT_732441 [Trichonephila clavata]|uniref:Uncharacterized protein n=1 Tax=Trichonephila clavata TaxID=2740835 RepID=A0A8X6G1Q6_TRICU|nr:hypothetical protein TNCT_454341 [Trichonephila clavata]GFR02006.1 hypothetical protein TNCT_732441 [Trichonephila clavata]